MRSGRLIGLDLLRLLAVALVLGAHLDPPRPEGASLPIDAWRAAGTLGVDLFFVLSGFLVSGLLFAEYRNRGELSLSRFYMRRAWRIHPPFYALILFSYLYTRFALGHSIPPAPLVSELLFVQSYVQGFWWHTWTLAVEEHFYLAMPLVLLALVRMNPRSGDPDSVCELSRSNRLLLSHARIQHASAD